MSNERLQGVGCRELGQRQFGDRWHIRQSLNWFEKNEAEQQERIAELDKAVEMTNSDPTLIDPGVRRLRELMKDNEVKLMGIGEMEFEQERSSKLKLAVIRAWKDATLSYPEWANREFPLPSMAGSAVGMEVWGRALGYYWQDCWGPDPGLVEEINRTVVVAVESTLALRMPESKLFEDVRGWIREEPDSFSIEVRKAAGLKTEGQK